MHRLIIRYRVTGRITLQADGRTSQYRFQHEDDVQKPREICYLKLWSVCYSNVEIEVQLTITAHYILLLLQWLKTQVERDFGEEGLTEDEASREWRIKLHKT